ncbi:hypothetical protein [Sneathiella glossodoripedis]|uniref:hypothetical protein n=1 Tax=Sneathiella glossodoripedis TaxID=418853 RepID=UPI00047250F6|nr:hypothetical protein [Sneathiella glossodoripedis]
MPKTYSYPGNEIRKEYYRSGAGMLLSGVPLLLFGPSSVIVSLLGCFFCLFSLYGIRAFRRSRLKIVLGKDTIKVTGLREKTILWEELEGVKLSYYSTAGMGKRGGCNSS